jgi:GMP synthase-like glutamine amidotransferase
VQAFRVGARRQWGVQFHAEMGLDESRELVESRSTEPGRAEALLRNAVATPALASRLFANFRRSVEAGVSGTGER